MVVIFYVWAAKKFCAHKKSFFLCAHNFLAVPHKKNKMHTWNILAYFFVHLIFAVPTSDMPTD